MRFPTVAAIVLSAATASPAASAQSFTAQAVRTSNFLDAIGVNIHLESEWDTAYSDQANGGTTTVGTDPALGAVRVNHRTTTNVSRLISALRYIGVTHARMPLTADYVADRLQAITQSIPALKIDLVTSTTDAITDEVMVRAGRISSQIEAVEGLNEATVSARYEGLTGVEADCRFQSELYGVVQSFNSAHGVHVPTLAPTATGNWGDFAALSVCASAATAANGHLYTDANPPTRSVLRDFPYDAKDAPAGAPIWGTEAGMSTNGAAPRGMNADVAAKRELSELLSYYANHVVRTYLYETVDEKPQTPMLNDNANSNEMEQHYGLFYNDWTAKPAAKVIHAQYELLKDTGAAAWTFVPQALKFTLSGAPPATYWLLMQKSTGSLILALWPEPSDMWVPATNTRWGYQRTIPATAVTVSFEHAFSSIQVADPFAVAGVQGSPTPNARGVVVSLSDHPVYLKLQP